MPNRDGIVSIGFDYKKDLEKMIKDFEAEMNAVSSNTQLSKGVKKQFDNVLAEMREFKASMDKELANLGSGKVNQSSFKSFKQTVENKFKGIREDIDRLDLAVSTLNNSMGILGKGVDLSKISNDFKNFEDYITRTNSAVENLIHTLGEQGISLFSFDDRNISDVQSTIRKIDSELKLLDKDTGAEFELFDEKQAQNELNKLSVQLVSTLELMENAKKQMENMDTSTDGFKKIRGEFALLQLKAASLNDTIEMLYEVTESKDIYIEMDDKSLSMYEKYTDELADNLESITTYAKNAKKELSLLLDAQKAPVVKVSSEMNPNSTELAATVTIETSSSELWKKLSLVITDLQDILNSNPVIAPVKLVVAPTSVSSAETGNLDTSKAYSKKYAKVLAQTGEDAVVDLEGVFKKTFTSVMDTAVSYAKETIGKIQEIFDKNFIGVKFDISQEEIDKIQNFVLSNKDGKKVDISGQITKTKQEVEELNESIEKTVKLLDDTKSKENIKFDGFDKFTQDVSKSIGKLEELQNILKALQNIEITLAKSSGISSITELDNQWANVEKRILNATKLDGSFRKNASVNKIASEYQKYIDMGGTNSIADIDKIKDNKDTLDAIAFKAKEFAKQDLSNDSVKELSIELDGIIGKFDELISTVKTATNALYKIIKQTGVSELDKQWSSITNKFKSLADESGKINLSKQKKDVEELLVMYQRYVNIGGSHTPFDLTDNLETVAKLNKAYKKLNETKPIDNSSTIESESESFKQIEQSVDSLTKAIGDTKVKAINIEATAMEDAAEREILAINAIVDNLNMVVSKLKEIKGIKIPKIQVENVSPGIPVETNISSGNEIIKEQIKEHNSLQDELRETIALTNEFGEVIDVYRGTRGLIGNGSVSNRYHGGTFWTSSRELATQYADENKVTHANLYMKNPYVVHGGGSEWDELYLSIKQGEELEQHLEDLYSSINDIFTKIQNISGIEAGHLVDVFNGQVNFTDFENNIINPITSFKEFQDIFENIDFNNSKIPQVQNYIRELYNIFTSFARLSELSEKGVLNTNEITEIAKSLHYDGVIFNQIYDGIPEPSDVFVTFEENQSKVIDIISSAQLKLEEQQERAKLFIDTRKNLYDTLKTLSKEQINEYIDKSAINFVTEGSYLGNLSEVFDSIDVREPLDDIKSKIREYINGIIQEFRDVQAPIKDTFQDDVKVSAESSAPAIKDEAKAMEHVAENAEKASKGKDKFAKANKKVKESADSSADSIEKETSALDEKEWDKNVKAIQEYMDANTKLNNLKAQDKGTGKKTSEIAYQTKEVEKLEKVAIEARAALSSMINPHEAPIDDWNKWVEAMKQFDQATEGSARSVARLEDALRNMQNSKVESFESKKTSYIKKLNPYVDTGKYVDDFVNKTKALQTELNGLDFTNPEDIQRLKQIDDELQQIISDSKLLENKLVKQDSKIADIISKMKIFRDSNTNMSKTQRTDLQALIDSAEALAKTGNVTAESIENIKIGFSGIKAQVTETGNEGLKFIDRITQRAKDMNAKFFAQFFSWQDWIRYLRQGFEIINDIDKSITELRKVSNGTQSDLNHALKDATVTAKELGASISNIVSMQADWARLGFSIPESEELARVTQLYVNVGDNMSAESASENLISTLQGFQLEAKDSERIIDMFNEVANNFAIDTQGIGEALKRSAASFNSANTSLSESIALVTTANAVVQDPDSIGTTFKTLSARIRGAETELESLGEETDEYTKTTSKLRDLVMSLTGFDIMEDEVTFKSIYDIMLGIGKEWDKLTDIEQSSLGEALAGKRNANVLYSIMQNINQLEDAYKTAEESAGSARREQENYEKSIQYSIDSARASLEALVNDLIKSDFLKGFIDAGASLIDFLDLLIDKFGVIGTLTTVGGGILGAKNAG